MTLQRRWRRSSLSSFTRLLSWESLKRGSVGATAMPTAGP
jgi:hypothetical protein